MAAFAVTTEAGGGHMGEVKALVTKYRPELTQYCKNIDDNLIINIDGEPYVIIDIGLRMLTPRELAYAQFGWAPIPGTDQERALAADYELTGTQGNQVAKIGNSVPPLVAAAIVRCNYPNAIVQPLDHTLLKAA
jgi:DNA (cytosine-5)-methyltransferase 1